MTAPALSAVRFGIGLLLGAGLGLFYGFLRPLRRAHAAPADLVFSAALFAAWVYFSFAVCQGDIRPGTTFALLLGALGWELTVGRLLRGVFRLFWEGIGGILALLTLPFQKFFEKIGNFCKKVFASIQKRGTIDKSNRRQSRRRSGGQPYEQAAQLSIQYQAGLPPRQPPDQAGTAGGHRIVYGDAGGPVHRRQARRGKK